MARPIVKICGITNLDDALYCSEAGADALGFIFHRESPRFVEALEAARIIHALPPFVVPAGVFVNTKRSIVEQTITETGIRIVQFSGDEAPEDCANYDVVVWKAFRFDRIEEVESIHRYKVSAVMLDGARNGLCGGSGVLADFAIARKMMKSYPLVLAGGLNPENALNAIRMVQPFGIDINSGVESSPGRKDKTKVKQLFQKLNQIPRTAYNS